MNGPDSEPGTFYQRETDQGTPPETTDLQVELPLPWSLSTGCHSLARCLLHRSLRPVYTSLVLIVAVLGLYFAATDHMGVVIALGVFGALCGFLLSGVSAFRQNCMEANMVTKTEANAEHGSDSGDQDRNAEHGSDSAAH